MFGIQQEFLENRKRSLHTPPLRCFPQPASRAYPRNSITQGIIKSQSQIFWPTLISHCLWGPSSSPPLEDTAWDMRRQGRRCALGPAAGDCDSWEPRSVPGHPCCPFPPPPASAALTGPHHRFPTPRSGSLASALDPLQID